MRNFLFFVTLLVCFTAFTQNPKGVEERVEKARITLDLTPTQVSTWKSIYETYDSKMNSALRKRDRSKLKQLSKTKEEELKATLTDAQKIKYDEWVRK